jgi:hypothetical protein
MFLQNFCFWHFFGNLLCFSGYPHHSTIPQPNKCFISGKIRIMWNKIFGHFLTYNSYFWVLPLLQDFQCYNLYYYSVGWSARSLRSKHVPHLRCGRLYFDYAYFKNNKYLSIKYFLKIWNCIWSWKMYNWSTSHSDSDG